MAEQPSWDQDNEEINEDSYQDVGRFIWEIIKVVVLAVIIIVPIRVFLFQPFFVQGASMEPNFDDGQYLIVNELGYKQTNIGIKGIEFFTVYPFKELQRGDVVIFHPPADGQKYFIKRIIGLPGETVEVQSGKVYVTDLGGNRELLDERQYLPASVLTSGNLSKTLGEDEYFVLGDNRSVSSDSRAWGPIKREKIVGKVLLRAWPLNKVSIF